MHLTATREHLLGAATRATSFTNRKNTIPILSYALLTVTDTATFTATDLERQIVDVFEAEIKEPGTVVLPIIPILDIVKKLPKGAEIDLRHTGDEITIKSGRYVTRMSTLPVDDYPVFAMDTPSITLHIEAGTLRDRLNAVSFAMSNEETRFYLNGVYVHTDGEKMKFVATDGHRLALAHIVGAEVEGDLNKGIIIPRSTVADMVRLLDGDMPVTVRASESRIMFHVGSAVITSKLIDGAFPEYQRVIPKHHDGTTVRVPASALSHAVERVAAVSSEKSRPVKFTIGVEDVVLGCTDPHGNTAEDVISAGIVGKPVDIGFQARYVQDVMTRIVAESVWTFGDSGSPAVVTDSGNGDFMAIVMPMRA